MEKRELTCICCPIGCQISVDLDNGEVKEISGNSCKRGEIYAAKEVVDPRRVVTSTVVVSKGKKKRVSCKTEGDIPKTEIFKVMREINHLKVVAPVHIGDVLIEDIAKTGVRLVASSEVKEL